MPLPRTIVDEIEDVLGEQLTRELALRIAPETKLIERLREAVHNAPERHALPDLPPGHLRPYISPQSVSLPFYANVLDVRDLSALLVYVHQVAIYEPLDNLFNWTPPFNDEQTYVTSNLKAALWRLADMSALVRAGVVVPIPLTRLPARKGSLVYYDAISLATDRFDFTDYPLPDLAEIDAEPPTVLTMVVENTMHAVSHSLVMADRAPGQIHLHLPYHCWTDALDVILDSTMLDASRLIGDEIHELRRLPFLTQTAFPSLRRLEPEDIVSVRENELSFEQLRRAVGRGLERIENLGLEGFGASEALRDELIDLRVTVERDLDRSRFLGAGKNALVQFAIGSVVATGTSVAFESLFAAAAGLSASAATSALQLVSSYLRTRDDRRTSKALLNHVVQFWTPN